MAKLALKTACTITQGEDVISVNPGEVPIFSFNRFSAAGAATLVCNFFSSGCPVVQIIFTGWEDEGRADAVKVEQLVRRILAARPEFVRTYAGFKSEFTISEDGNYYDAHHILTLTVT